MDRVEVEESLSLSDVDIEGFAPSSPTAGPAISSSSVIGKGPVNHSYPWLSKISTISLDLCGSDLSQRMEISCPNGPSFKTDMKIRRDENDTEAQDQHQFTLLSNKNEQLLTVDFSKDLKSFHIMEPDSNTFIAFFTVHGSVESSRVDIQNVIDGEMYHVESSSETPIRLVIKSEQGEEMGTISRPPPKWTQFMEMTMTLNFTGDERDGLTTREKAIVLGFLIALGVLGMDYWKRSSSGLISFYIICVLFFLVIVIFIYCRFREGVEYQHKVLKNAAKNSTLERQP